jgi:hypothetical protein
VNEPRQIIYRPAAAAGRAPEEQRPTHPLRWQWGSEPQPGEVCAQCLGRDWWRSGSLGGCWCCHPPPPSWGVERFST